MKTTFLIFIFLLLSIENAISADKGDTYAGIQYSMMTYNESPYGDWSPVVLLGRYGINIEKNFAIEGRFGIGLDDDSKTIPGYPIEGTIEIDNMMGVYAVSMFPISMKSEVYAFAGLTRISVTATASASGMSYSASDTETGISFGVGTNIRVGETIALNIEYANYYDKDDVKIDAMAIGATFYF